MTEDKSIPIFGGGDVPQFLFRLAKAVAEGRIECLGVVYSTAAAYQTMPLIGDIITLQGLYSRAICELNMEME